MQTKEILQEINDLSVEERIYIIEKTINSIRRQNDKEKMKKAADELYDDYLKDDELTAFTSLDSDEFYETK